MKCDEKIFEIERILNSVSKRKIRNSYALAKGLYFRLRLEVSFRTVPVFGGWKNYSWSNFRYWTQKLKKMGKLDEIKQIVWR